MFFSACFVMVKAVQKSSMFMFRFSNDLKKFENIFAWCLHHADHSEHGNIICKSGKLSVSLLKVIGVTSKKVQGTLPFTQNLTAAFGYGKIKTK